MYRFSFDFHLYDTVVKHCPLDLEESFGKDFMQIRLKYGQTLFEVNGLMWMK